MKTSIALIMLCLCLGAQAQQAPAQLEQLGTGYVFTEGPVWCDDGYMLFSDIRGGVIYKWTQEDGVRPFMAPSQFTNGNTYDGEYFYLARYTTHDIARMDRNAQVESIVDNYQGKRFNSPNDIIVSKKGNIYFVDPEFGVAKEDKVLDFHGFYIIPSGSNEAVLIDKLSRPNGLALSPDQSLLYLCETEGNILYTYELDEKGNASDRQVFCEIPGPGNLDGLTCHSNGYLFVALGFGGMVVVSPEGEIVDRVSFDTDESIRNMCFGVDGNTMFITAGNSFYRYYYDLSKLK